LVKLLFVIPQPKRERLQGLLPVRPAFRVQKVLCDEAGRVRVGFLGRAARDFSEQPVLNLLDGIIVLLSKTVSNCGY
jgi:hypothetical protein